MSKTKPVTAASHWRLPTGARYLGPHAPDETLDVTMVLRRMNPLGALAPSASRSARHADFVARYGADPADVDRMRNFSRKHGLQELACEPGRRTCICAAPRNRCSRHSACSWGITSRRPAARPTSAPRRHPCCPIRR